MPTKQRFLPPIPDGHQLFASFEVAGIQFYKSAARKFIQGRDHSIELVRDPGNKYDPNAIAVYGVNGKKRHHIGHVPAQEASAIVNGGLFDQIQPRLRSVYLSDAGFAVVGLDISGPKPLMNKWRESYDSTPPLQSSRRPAKQEADGETYYGCGTLLVVGAIIAIVAFIWMAG